MAAILFRQTPSQKVIMNLKAVIKRILAMAFRRLHEMSERMAEQDLPQFANKPRNLRIELPRRVSNAEAIHVGNNVTIGPNSLLVAQTSYPSSVMQHPERPVPLQHFQPCIRIGHRVTATGMLTLSAMKSVTIEDDVMFGSNVFISDGMHGFQNASTPYKYQPMWRIAPVVIKRGCWIGQNAMIMPGVTIGEFSIIGANSVVTKNIPPRCIAAGTPARLIKRWDDDQQGWVAVADTSSPVVIE
jgi:acetyltransferase-like isoleucine patch superfamily enzyme